MSRFKCERCRARYAVSSATRLCEVCLYAEQFGVQKAAEQEAKAAQELARRKAAKVSRE